MRRLNFITTSGLLLFWPSAAIAQPAIASTSHPWKHKGSITITGSGFGSKEQAQPTVWDDASGVSIFEKWDGAWPDCSGNGEFNLDYRTPAEVGRGIPLPHRHVTRYIAGAHNPGAGPQCGYNVILFKTRTIAYPAYTYASWYHRADDGWVFGDDNNYKTFAFSEGTGPYQLPDNWYLAYNTPWPDSTSSGASYIFGDDSNGGSLQFPDANGHNQWWDSAVNPMSGVWTKVEMEIKYTNQNEGYVRLWENGVLRVDYAGSTDRYPGFTRTEGIGGYARMYNQPTNWRYFADVYLDYSRARVILGNAPTLSGSTIREVQIPTTWSGSSISVTANLGALRNGRHAYLYVVDSDGQVNAEGFPVPLTGEPAR